MAQIEELEKNIKRIEAELADMKSTLAKMPVEPVEKRVFVAKGMILVVKQQRGTHTASEFTAYRVGTISGSSCSLVSLADATRGLSVFIDNRQTIKEKSYNIAGFSMFNVVESFDSIENYIIKKFY